MIITPALSSLHPNSGFSVIYRQRFRVSRTGLSKSGKPWKHSMRLTAGSPFIKDGALTINGRDALTGVPENVTISTPTKDGSAFLGAISNELSCRHVFKLGVLLNYRLLCLFRFKIWWMVPRFGKSGRDVPVESQMLLLEAKEETSVVGDEKNTFYILFLPVLDGPFRSSLQGNSSDELEFCIESGDPFVEASRFQEAVFVNYGDNPFNLMKDSMKILQEHMGTFSLRENKKMPGMLDWFGWCTWDAFYTEVNPQGIKEGLKNLSEGGTPARFLIIDDGWQDIENEFQREGEPFIEGSQHGARLVSIRENHKFRRNTNVDQNQGENDLKDFISTIKETFGLKYVYLWHALMGHWGGLNPDSPGMKKYNPKLLYPVQSPGNLAHDRDTSMDAMERYGVGVIDTEKIHEFYDDQHRYLASQNVDGVKVDVQNILETVAGGRGGRVCLTRAFQKALESSVATHFRDNSIICCMGQNTDSMYSSKASAITRVSDDYMPRNRSSQTLHIAAVSFNSILFGEIVVPDWDMFYSLHYAAEFHAAARALGGCGVYISDKPNEHDFGLLKKLVLPDGSVLRAKYSGRPTRDCLFNDPVMDGQSLLKIWNLNACNGVIGAFNCQGAGNWPCSGIDLSTTTREIGILEGRVSPSDIEYLEEVGGKNWSGDCAVYSFNTGSLLRVPKNGSVDVSLKVLQSEVFTISPIKVFARDIRFAPIGLINMYNSGGAVESVNLFDESSKIWIRVEGRGEGLFGGYSSEKPKICTVNSKEEEFSFSSEDKFLKLVIPSGIHGWIIDIFF